MHEAMMERDGAAAGERVESTGKAGVSCRELVERAVGFGQELAGRPNLGLQVAPKREVERLGELGLLMAPFPARLGGVGMGVETGTHGALLRVLAAIGGGDLALGRLYEGHVNGVLLVLRYGTAEQAGRLAEEVRGGMLSGVWNTGRPELMRLVEEDAGEFRLEGGKTFATGAAFVKRPIVTAERVGSGGDKHGWQMTLARMEELPVTIDRSFWHPLGMESSESFGVEFTGGRVTEGDLVGGAGDFYRDPMFRGGAVRFAAVQAGAVLRLQRMFAEWLYRMRRGDDPYQVARLGEVTLAAQEAALWVERAGAVAEESFYRDDQGHAERMIDCANQMRTAVERLATAVMQKVVAGVGAHGLLQPARFERVVRDLTMYLRQPAPDQTLAAVGRSALDRTRRREEGSRERSRWEFWSEMEPEESLPVGYFQRIYERHLDPWGFETSAYEREKYGATLAALPRGRYESGVEVGCSIGVLTEKLATRCEELVGVDVAERALERARKRCEGMEWVSFEQVRVPQEWPEGEFDLVVVSEVGYYWSQRDLERAADGLAERQSAEGHLVLVHLTETVPDYPLTGDAVHEYWLGRPEWRRVGGGRWERFRIDVLERI